MMRSIIVSNTTVINNALQAHVEGQNRSYHFAVAVVLKPLGSVGEVFGNSFSFSPGCSVHAFDATECADVLECR